MSPADPMRRIECVWGISTKKMGPESAGRKGGQPVCAAPAGGPYYLLMAAMVRRVRDWLPLTSSGLVSLALSLAALRFGLARQDLILTLAGAWGLGLLGMAGLSAGLSALSFRRELSANVDQAGSGFITTVAGQPTTTGAKVRRRFRPLVRRAIWRWQEPRALVVPADRGDRLAEIAVPTERGVSPQIVRRYEVGDVFGLWRIRGHHVQQRPVLVKPDVGALTSAELSSCLTFGDLVAYPWGKPQGDRVDSRPYTRSDPARLILWKVYARTRELMVRVAEPARSPEARPVVYLVASPEDPAAAGVARLIMEDELFGSGTRFACDGYPQPTSDPDQVAQALAGSRDHRRRSGIDLAACMAHPDVSADDPFVIVCAATKHVSASALVPTMGSDPQRFVVLAAHDVASTTVVESGWRRWMLTPLETDGVKVESMVAACRPMAQTGVRISLVDRRGGRILPIGGDVMSAASLEKSA